MANRSAGDAADSNGHPPSGKGIAPVRSPFRIRDLSSPILTEVWLVSAVVCILGIRIYLELTGYPQVGGSKL
ncbi:MAG TPA: hypothetical protein VNZ55_12160, partial [Thermomicrobiales bacterium]|nr:hypothetical protein [Thermomicrobiales bacterium]